MKDEQQSSLQPEPQLISDATGAPEAPNPGGNAADSSWMEKMNQASAVAASSQQKKFMVLGLLAFVGIIGYYLMFGRTPSAAEVKEKQVQNLAQKKEAVVKSAMPVTAPILSSSAPTQAVETGLPALQQLQEPTPPAPPVAPLPPVPAAVFSQDPTPLAPPTAPVPPPSSPGAPPVVVSRSIASQDLLKTDSEAEKEAAAAKLKKRNSGVIVFGSGSGEDAKSGDDKSAKAGDKTASNAGFLGFGEGSFDNVQVAKTSATQVSATSVGNTDNIILQGKMMNAVLETAINTDLPGSLRAVITRDVYAESGNRILVPKGSRVIGTYANTIGSGQTRVQVKWSRLVRPDGIDVAVSSAGTDNLGRAGVVGAVDNKVWAQIGAALLVSYIIPSIANKVSGAADQSVSQSTSTSNGVSATTSTGNASAVSASDATSQFSNIAQNAINSAFPSQPTITVDQGTLINILVQADLIFPSEAALAQQKVVR